MGTDINSSMSMSLVIAAASGTIMETVEIPTLKLPVIVVATSGSVSAIRNNYKK